MPENTTTVTEPDHETVEANKVRHAFPCRWIGDGIGEMTSTKALCGYVAPEKDLVYATLHPTEKVCPICLVLYNQINHVKH